MLINDKCEFDEFFDEYAKNSNYEKELAQIQQRLEALSNDQHLPKEKFKELKGRKSNDSIKDYEIRTKNLRVYLFKDPNSGKIIVFGAKKSNRQTRDISRLRSIKKEYCEF